MLSTVKYKIQALESISSTISKLALVSYKQLASVKYLQVANHSNWTTPAHTGVEHL
jgi:hypothetical protein